MVVENACGMKAMHNGKTKAKVIINKKEDDIITGICGDCNGEPDDLRLRDGTDVSHEKYKFIMIGNSYAENPDECKCINNPELNDLRKIICLSKSEVSVERISVCNVNEQLAEHSIHYWSCSYINGVIIMLP